MAKVPFVVALNRADDGRRRSSRSRSGDTLDLDSSVPVVPCNAIDRQSVKDVLLALLYAVVDSIEVAAV